MAEGSSNPEHDPGKRVAVDAGSEITGALISGAAGLAIAGPPGVVVGAVVGPIVRRVLDDFALRRLSPRESARVDTVAGLAARRIRDEQGRGRLVRSDGFFAGAGTPSAPFEEVLEEALMTAQRESQQQKLPYLAQLLAEVALRADVDSDTAFQLIRVADQLTYRQLVLLALFGRQGEFLVRDDSIELPPRGPADAGMSVIVEIADLASRNLAGISGDTGTALLDVIPSAMEPAGLGGLLFDLMLLKTTMPSNEIRRVVSLLEKP